MILLVDTCLYLSFLSFVSTFSSLLYYLADFYVMAFAPFFLIAILRFLTFFSFATCFFIVVIKMICFHGLIIALLLWYFSYISHFVLYVSLYTSYDISGCFVIFSLNYHSSACVIFLIYLSLSFYLYISLPVIICLFFSHLSVWHVLYVSNRFSSICFHISIFFHLSPLIVVSNNSWRYVFISLFFVYGQLCFWLMITF